MSNVGETFLQDSVASQSGLGTVRCLGFEVQARTLSRTGEVTQNAPPLAPSAAVAYQQRRADIISVRFMKTVAAAAVRCEWTDSATCSLEPELAERACSLL